jgi:hypothetical protein
MHESILILLFLQFTPTDKQTRNEGHFTSPANPSPTIQLIQCNAANHESSLAPLCRCYETRLPHPSLVMEDPALPGQKLYVMIPNLKPHFRRQVMV